MATNEDSGCNAKIAQHAHAGTKDSQILRMGLSRAFDAINRTQLWAAIYKKGIPLYNIPHIRKGHHNTNLCAKHRGRYDPQIKNNIGVSQGSAVSALLFIIYLDDVTVDYDALSRNAGLSARQYTQRDPSAGNTELIEIIKKNAPPEHTAEKHLRQYVQKLTNKIQLITQNTKYRKTNHR